MIDRAIEVFAGAAGAGLWPQNSKAAIRNSIALGVDGLELDLQLTADGVPILMHDEVIGPHQIRLQRGGWYDGPPVIIRQTEFADLAAFDMGDLAPESPWRAVFPDYQSSPGEAIFTLEGALAMIADADRPLKLMLEIKSSPFDREATTDPEELLPPVIALLERFDMITRTHFIAMEWAALQVARTLKGSCSLAPITSPPGLGGGDPHEDMAPWYRPFTLKGIDAAPALLADMGADIWDAYDGQLTAERIIDAHNRGLKVGAWGLIDANRAAELAAMGVDSITSPRPDLFLRGLGRR